MRNGLFLVILLILGGRAQAVEKVNLEIAAGKQAHMQEPVTVPLQLPESCDVNMNVRILDDKGARLAWGQLTPPDLLTGKIAAEAGKKRLDLHFILPELAAGSTRKIVAEIGGDMTAPVGFTSRGLEGEWSDLAYQDRLLLRYMHAPLDDSNEASRNRTFKVFHHVFDPSGETIITNGAGGQFPHHRGLFYGFMRCTYDNKTVDTWHCKGETHQAHRSLDQVVTGPVLGRQIAQIDWNGVGKKTFARETRELTAFHPPGGVLIDFTSRLTATDGPVKLDGDPQHAGFHFRAANEVAAKNEKQTVFTRPDGIDKPGATRNWDGKTNKTHVNLPWLAMSFVVAGKRYTALYLDRPDNPKEARYSERSYGRFGSYFVTTVTKDKPLQVHYRVWIQEGTIKPAQAAAMAAAFTSPVTVTQK